MQPEWAVERVREHQQGEQEMKGSEDRISSSSRLMSKSQPRTVDEGRIRPDIYMHHGHAMFGQNVVFVDSTERKSKFNNIPGKDAEGHTSLIDPSQEAEMKNSLSRLDQSTEKTSRVCSCHAHIGRS